MMLPVICTASLCILSDPKTSGESSAYNRVILLLFYFSGESRWMWDCSNINLSLSLIDYLR